MRYTLKTFFLLLGLSSFSMAQMMQMAKLVAYGGGSAGDQFGWSVSISGDYKIVGSHKASGGGENDSGSAYIFVRDGTSWSQQAILVASDRAASDWFGKSVSISGDYAVVGAYLDDDGGNNSGSAYIFVRDGTSWSQQAKLVADDAAAYDQFGNSVSISGDYVVVGASWDDDGGSNSGSAYTFVRSGTSWSQQAKLVADDAASGDYFGESVSISGDYALVGSYLDGDAGSFSGSAYTFVRDGTSWSQQAKLVASDGGQNYHFGESVSISGNYAVVGSHGLSSSGSNGMVYTFIRSGTSWSQMAKLVAGDGDRNDFFGNSVSISGDYAVVGAPYDDDGGSESGSAYVFKIVAIQNAKIVASDGAYYDRFGNSISTSGD